MKPLLKRFLLKFYKVVNALPFNNSVKARKSRIKNGGKLLYRCKIKSSGRNTIIFHKGGFIRNTTIHIRGNNNIIEIGENTCIKDGDIYIEDDNNNIVIGNGTNLCGKIHLACTEGTKIHIGNDCLFSSEIVFRTGDSHSIVDVSGNRTNFAADIIIGDHVWVGYRVLVNKGVTVPSNTVIGTGSVLTKTIDESNTVVAGVPAKIVKRNINWKHERTEKDV